MTPNTISKGECLCECHFQKCEHCNPPQEEQFTKQEIGEALHKQMQKTTKLQSKDTAEWEHATLENPCYCWCHTDGIEDECPECKKINGIVRKALSSQREQILEELNRIKHNRESCDCDYDGIPLKDGTFICSHNSTLNEVRKALQKI